ncbi:MAG TPA: glycosyltransferase family 1 protein [Vicinamibacterales bacterium]|nr:glycosyltransferase family 1 protein [Vicinamibacterales bacterium]
MNPGTSLRVGVDATSWISPRGFGRFMRNAVGRLVELDRDATYTFFIDEASAESARLPANVDVRRVPLSGSPTRAAAAGSTRSARDLLGLTLAVRREHLDVFLFPSLYTWFPVIGTPTIVGVHDTMMHDIPHLTVPSWRDRIAANIKHRAGMRLARTLFTVSEFSRRAITARFGIRAERLYLVPEAPDPVFAPRTGTALDAGLAAAGLRRSDRFFLFFGGISPHKNIEALLDAYAALRQDRGDTVPLLVLVGELETSAYASAAASVRQRIAAHGLGSSVRLPGYVTDETLACLCTAATAVVLPSLAEGFGLPAVEAAACGAPLALSELEAHRETMGEAALYFDPKDVGALARVLARLDADEPLCRRLSADARAAVRARTWDTAAAALATIVARTARTDDQGRSEGR